MAHLSTQHRSKFTKSRKKNAENTAHLLQKKLDSAEGETRNLVQQLTNLGFAPKQLSSGVGRGSHEVKPVEPFLPATVETETLYKSYEQLVSRACRTESQIQTLKLNLCSLQAEKELNSDEVEKLKEKLQSDAESHENQVKKLSNEIDCAKRRQIVTENGKKEAESEVKRLQAALQSSSSSKTNLIVNWDEQKVENQRQAWRVGELMEELSQETRLRKSLEDSHKILLQRIQEMEQVVERERQDMQTLVTACTKMKNDYDQMKEKRSHNAKEKSALEELVKKLKADLGRSDVQLNEILQENQALLVAAESMRQQMASLKEDMEDLKKLEKNNTDFKELRKGKRESDEKVAELEKRNHALVTECNGFQAKVKKLQEELDAVRVEPQDAAFMVAQAVESLNEEKSKIVEELEAAQMELARVSEENFELETEKRRLEERISTVELQEIAHKKVESSIAELVDGKNRLAYEKGQLQQRLGQLQKELEKAASAQTENSHLKRSKSSMEVKIKKVNEELSTNQLTIHKLQVQLRQEKNSSEVKERDFELAIQARDAALQEVEQMRKKMDAHENQQQVKIFGLHKSLSDAQNDHSKLSSMLDSVMASHQQVQMNGESLQTELGRKDREMSSLKQERQNNLRTLQHLQGEIKTLQGQIASMEDAGLGKMDQIQRQLIESINKNNLLSLSLDELSQTNRQLQSALEGIQNEVERKDYEIKLLQEARQNDQSESERQMHTFQERLESLQNQLTNQKSLVHKRTQKEITDLRQSNMEMAARISEQSKDNSDLHEKISGLEGTLTRQRDRIQSQKSQLDSYHDVKNSNKELMSKLERCEVQLDSLEKAKKEYLSKNKEQVKTITEFVSQVNALQEEIEDVTKHQSRSRCRHSRHQGKDVEGSKEDSLRRENEKLKQRLAETKNEKQALEARLSDVSNESVQISGHLQDAHDWFKQKYSGLQKELVHTKQRQMTLERTAMDQEHELEEERVRSSQQTQRAYDMIRSSREALKKVANQVEKDHIENKSHMHFLARRVQAERDHANYTDRKINKLMNSSAEYIEDLALELDLTRSKLDPSVR